MTPKNIAGIRAKVKDLRETREQSEWMYGHQIEYCHDAELLLDEIDRLEAELAEERGIVNRIWVLLGSPSYESLNGKSIYDLISNLQAELADCKNWLDYHSTDKIHTSDSVIACCKPVREAYELMETELFDARSEGKRDIESLWDKLRRARGRRRG
jgi:hypothetical protein